MEQTKQTKGEKSRQKLIETAADLFLQKGYFHTGIADILKSCNLTKGSFYFYFSGKDELGKEAAVYFREKMHGWLEEKCKKAGSYKGFVDGIVDDILNQIEEGCYYGCPFTCFATETAPVIPEIRAECTKAVILFEKVFTDAVKSDGISEEQARQKGRRALAAYEGMLMCYRITQDKGVIENMRWVLCEGEASGK